MLEYTTPYTPQLNGIIERILAATKEGLLAMMLNAKLYDTAQKILWLEAVHTCERVKKVWLLISVQHFGSKLFMKKTEDHWLVLAVWKNRLCH